MRKQQIFIVHGGEVFDHYEQYLTFLKDYKVNLDKVKNGGWKDRLSEVLGAEYEVIAPLMENYHNAKYLEWKIWFENFIPFIKDGVILLGSSLGGLFLAKYLSENNFPKKIKAIFMVAPPFDVKDRKDPGATLGDFILPDSLKNFRNQVEKIFIYQSKNDPVVPFADLDKYLAKLPDAEGLVFENRGHFVLKNFPEIVEKIKSIK